MHDYFKVLQESDIEDIKADMQLILKICAHNEINSEQNAKKIYTVVKDNEHIFKSGIGRIFIKELHDRINDYRYIDNVKKNKDLNDITVVRSVIEEITNNNVLSGRVGQSFLQQLISLEKELQAIQIIQSNYDLDNPEVVENLLLVLSEPGTNYFVTDMGKSFIASLESKSGKVYVDREKRKQSAMLVMIMCMFLVAGISLGIASKYFVDDWHSNEVAEDINKQTGRRPVSNKAPASEEYINSQHDILEGMEESKRATLILGGNTGILKEYEKLASENADMAGWLKVEGTDIDYPVMHRGDNSFYLEHNYYGDYDRNGSLFIDRYCSIFPQSENIIIYGHNVDGAPSFGQIKYYKDKDYRTYHPNIYFDTIYEKGVYEVVSAFTTSVKKKGFKYYLFYGYDNEEQFNEFADYIMANAAYDTGASLKYGDKFITLSTCDYAVSDGRFVVVARKIETE